MVTTEGNFESALGVSRESPPNPSVPPDPPAVSVLLTTPGENMTMDASPISKLTTHASSPGDKLSVSAQLTKTHGDTASSSDSPHYKSLGHQGDKITGGINENLRVLYCTNIPVASQDYETLFNSMKKYGLVERIKLTITPNKKFFESYITFSDSSAANLACAEFNEKKGDFDCKVKLIDHRNVRDDELDFIPKFTDFSPEKTSRNAPILTWHVVSYKEGRANFVRAAESLQNKIGTIPHQNIKRYGKNILIKAGNDTQRALLTRFKPSPQGNIEAVTPHRSFNVQKGVIFSSDLYEFSEEDILDRCPPHVCAVKKLKGKNSTILITFTSSTLPDSVNIGFLKLRVKKLKSRPSQCFKCFDYGHTEFKCQNKPKCYICSKEHNLEGQCLANRYCFHCSGEHSPNSKICPRYRFEQDILETADAEHISIGSAKRKLMGANRSLDSTYASVVKNMRRQNSNLSPQNPLNARVDKASSQPSSSKRINRNSPSTPTKDSFDDKTGSASKSALTSVVRLGSPKSLKANVRKTVSKTSSSVVSVSPQNKVGSLPDLYRMQKDEGIQDMREYSSSESLPDISTNIRLPKTKRESKNDFILPSTKKRSRQMSPKDTKSIKTSNSFAVLDSQTTPINESVHNQKLQLPKPLSAREVIVPPSAAQKVCSAPLSQTVKRLNKPFSAQHTRPPRASMSGKKSN